MLYLYPVCMWSHLNSPLSGCPAHSSKEGQHSDEKPKAFNQIKEKATLWNRRFFPHRYRWEVWRLREQHGDDEWGWDAPSLLSHVWLLPRTSLHDISGLNNLQNNQSETDFVISVHDVVFHVQWAQQPSPEPLPPLHPRPVLLSGAATSTLWARVPAMYQVWSGDVMQYGNLRWIILEYNTTRYQYLSNSGII